nr:TIGR02301 family protein [Pararhizobium capsulatum]
MSAHAQEAAAPAQPTEAVEKPAPYDGRLLRLSEILGSVHYLRVLCKATAPDDWRQTMQDLLDKEASGEAARRARMTAAFNRGYRTFASVYTACTPAAVLADTRYRAEGATLASEIVARFGN